MIAPPPGVSGKEAIAPRGGSGNQAYTDKGRADSRSVDVAQYFAPQFGDASEKRDGRRPKIRYPRITTSRADNVDNSRAVQRNQARRPAVSRRAAGRRRGDSRIS